MGDELKAILSNQIVILSALQNILDHFTAETPEDVEKNIEESKNLKKNLKISAINSKNLLTGL